MGVRMDKTLIFLWCCSACHHHHHHQPLSHTLSIFPGRNEWILSGTVLVDLWEANLQMKLPSSPGAQLCSCLILSQGCPTNGRRHMCTGSDTDRDKRTLRHEHATTPISSQGRGQAGGRAGFGGVWILAFLQLGASGPALFIRHPSRCQFGLWVQAPRVIRPLPCLPAGPPDGLLSGPRRTKSKHLKKQNSMTNRNMDEMIESVKSSSANKNTCQLKSVFPQQAQL